MAGKTNRIFVSRSGFTLVELLVVLVLIIILSGMTVVVVRTAIGSGKASAVQMQLHQLSIALDSYKTKIGEYPPDFSDPVAVMKHVKKRWPRSSYGTDVAAFNTFCNDIAAYFNNPVGTLTGTKWNFHLPKVDESDEDADIKFISPGAYTAALVFWLAGLPNSEGKLIGFSLDPKNPITGDMSQREEPLFKFPDDSIHYKDYTFTDANDVERDGKIPSFFINEAPVVFFTATNNTENLGAYAYPKRTTVTKYYSFDDGFGMAVPYGKSSGSWYEQERFQLIHPGVDGLFSAPGATAANIRVVDSQANLTVEDADNITSFSKGTTLSSEYK